MAGAATKQKIIDELYSSYLANGFITEDEAIACFVAHKIHLQEIDNITEHLLTIGVIVRYDNNEDASSDNSGQEFSEIFYEVIKKSPSLEPFIEYIRSITPPQHREAQNLIPQVLSGNKYAKTRLIEMNLRQAVKQALLFSKQYDLPLNDVMQNGLVGLIAAVEIYDPTKHNYFSTYAFQLIVRLIRRNQHLPCVYKIPLNEIGLFPDYFLSIGVIIKDSAFEEEYISTGRKLKTNDGEIEYTFDKSKLDYNDIYNEALDLDPGLEPFIEYIKRTPPPRHLEAQNLVNQLWNGDTNARKNARTRLIEMYLRTVVKLALYHSQRFGLPFDETLQNGLLGLIAAVEKFNPEEHENISTYAPWWIIQSMQRNRWFPNCPVYFPVHIRDKLFSIKEALEGHICEDCPSNGGRVCDAFVKEISEKNSLKLDETIFYMDNFYSWLSLDAIIENNYELHDYGELNEDLMDCFETSHNRHIISNLMKNITIREKEVLTLRYGFTDRGILTLEEVAGLYGLTRERIRQIEVKALRKMSKLYEMDKKGIAINKKRKS